jgi:hypothetical protein
MNTAGVEERNERAVEYFHLLCSLSSELEKAMQAIVKNRLTEFEESVLNQQMLSGRLKVLADELCVHLEPGQSVSSRLLDADQARQIANASETLQKLNKRYAALLQHSSRSVALMVSLFSSFKGSFPEASGARLKHQTWSCQM